MTAIALHLANDCFIIKILYASFKRVKFSSY